MKRFALALALMLLPAAGDAACRGVDFRDHLAPQVEARLERELAATPFVRGNHWVASKGSRRIHVIGTMHGGDSRMAGVMRRLRPALRAAEAIYLEVPQHLDSGGAMPPELLHSLVLPRGQELRRLLSRESWSYFETAAKVSGTSLETLNRMQPWAVSMFLVQNGCRPYGFGLRRGLDDRIADFARRRRIPLGALETPQQALGALSGMPLRDQARMLDLELALMRSDMPEDATPVEAYFDQNVWSAFVLAPWIGAQYSPFSAAETQRLWQVYNRHLLDQRNRKWMKVIRAAGQTQFVVAVGAAHLPGKSGLLNLLQAEGYSLSPAPW